MSRPSYSADWGDYISFAHHLREKADADGSDLLLIDTGDRVEGNGLYDASDPKGQYTFEIFKHQHIDVICAGNHELYKLNSSENELFTMVPNFKGHYLASNIDIYNPKSGELVPLAQRFRKFTTKNQGIRIVAFGFLFDFHGNYNNTIVLNVEDTVKQKWFQDVIRDKEVDLFLVTGHVDIRSSEQNIIYKAIRDVQWDTPIHFFGGHYHIRDYKKLDSITYAMESGRYMETVGFASISGLRTHDGLSKELARPKFARRYIDNNLFSYHHHSNKSKTTFPTELGQNVSKQITDARTVLKLDHKHGCAPKDLWMDRVQFGSSNSIFTWLNKQVIPDSLSNANGSKLVFSNTGAVRFDIFKGPFTIDTTFLVSPFTSGLRYVKGVDYAAATKILDVLNNEGKVLDTGSSTIDSWLLAPPKQLRRKTNSNSNNDKVSRLPIGQQHVLGSEKLTPGYTTKDDAGDDGDDTIHSPIPSYRVPNCFQTAVDFPPHGDAPDTVDVVYNSFVEPWIISALNFLGQDYELKDALDYSDKRIITTIISDWVEKYWPCD